MPLKLVVLCFTLLLSNSSGTHVSNYNGIIYCDTLTCPPEAVRCHVRTINDPNDFSTLITSRKCYDRDNQVVAEKNTASPNTQNLVVNSVQDTHTGATQLTPEQQAQLEANLLQIQQNVQLQLQQVQQQVQNIQYQVRQNIAHWNSIFPGNFY